MALDGLEPEAGEPQLWFIRELSTGLTLRSGWLSRQTQGAFDLAKPLSDAEFKTELRKAVREQIGE